MAANPWCNAVKQAIVRITQQQTGQHTRMNSKPLSVALELEDALALSEHQSSSSPEPVMAMEYLHAERAIPVPVDIASMDDGSVPMGTTSFQVSFPATMPQDPPGQSSGYTARFAPDALSGSTGTPRKWGTRRARGMGLKPVCVRCHKMKKRCEGIFPCKSCRAKSETCVERVGKRKKKEA
ncbi:hypothetical protein C8T65DRAFT_834001 [Cerioporus squamosus]|nr:hypothetical protein C8T65DRAFT_834001 [Cerioporus squamosus]